MRIVISPVRFFLLALTLAAARPLVGQGTEILHGRVLDTQKHAVADVEVVATGIATHVAQSAKTTATGEYTIVFHDPDGSYALAFRKVGFGAFNRTVRQSGLSGMIEVSDVVLPGGINVLQPLVSNTTRKVPARYETPSVGGVEMNTANNALFVTDPGDLNAIAGLLPGVVTTDSGYSINGASPGQNKVLVDGMDFGGSSLPRDAIAREKVISTSFDVSKGQFAGGETVVTTRQGSDFFASTVRVQGIDPHLAWPDPASFSPVPRTGYLSGYLSGPIIKKKLNYSFAFDASDRSAALSSLASTRSELLDELGISADSVAAFTSTLNRFGVPVNGHGAPQDQGARQLLAVLRTDYKINGLTSFTFSATGNWNSGSGLGISPLSFPVSAGRSTSNSVRYLLKGGTYVHRILEDFSIAFTPGSTSSSPYLDAPTGLVQVGSAFADGRSGLSAFRFGGGGGVSSSSGRTWDVSNEVSWATPDTHNQIKFTQELRFDRGGSTRLPSPGSFTFQSLDDLAANRPSSYLATMSTVTQSSSATIGALSLGDIWRIVPGKFDVQGGVRFDTRTFGTRPAFNPVLDTLFGIHTDRVPSDQGFSPRLGFSWSPAARHGGGLPDGMAIVSASGVGTVKGFMSPLDAAGIALLAPGNDVSLTGGIGAYRGVISAQRVGALDDATGLPSTTQYLTCVGTAAPIPDWSLASTVPLSRCADGTSSGPLAATQPRVTVFDPAFRAPVTWRGNLQLTGWRLHGWAIAPRLTYSVGINSESTVDGNLRRTALFTLQGESARPVYAAATDIVPESGFFAPTASRVAAAYGAVQEVKSDLHYHAGEVLIAAAPPKPLFGKVPLYAVYAYSSQQHQQRGFGGTTAGDPFAIETVAGQQPTHQFIVGANNIRVWWFTLATRVAVLSGTRYTPTVAQDINGDGYANDRAFVANPVTAPDTALGSQLRTLLAAAPARAQACLLAQFGSIASANSCETPWQARLDFNLAFTPPQNAGVGNRLRITANLLNASGALVRLFGLQNTPLGQGASAQVDNRLLYVTGFDPATQRFRYRVNQLFGAPIDFATSQHAYPPFQIQVGAEYRFGYPPTASTARSLGVFSNTKDTAQMAATARQSLLRSLGANPVETILSLRDSLGLGADQVASISAVDRAYVANLNGLLAPVVAFAVQRGKKLTVDELSSRMMPLSTSIRNLRDDAQQHAIAFLLAEQRTKLATMAHLN